MFEISGEVQLSDVLFMGKINDLSFTIDDRIVVLIEHQSTINENVPLRLLMYIARVYEKIINRAKLYQRRLVTIPTPEFIVLYNGKEEYDNYKELRLSDAFKALEGLKLTKNNILPLELVVQVYNINHGRNPAILEKSKTLSSYTIFMEKIREYNKEKSLEESVKAAIKYCIGNDILKQFLKDHASEVLSMLTEEPSIDEIIAVRCEEVREEVREERNIAIARNLLVKGSTPEFVQEITGLDMEIIRGLNS